LFDSNECFMDEEEVQYPRICYGSSIGEGLMKHHLYHRSRKPVIGYVDVSFTTQKQLYIGLLYLRVFLSGLGLQQC